MPTLLYTLLQNYNFFLLETQIVWMFNRSFCFKISLSKKRFSFGKNGVSGMTKCVSFYVDEMPTNCEIIFQKIAETFPTVTQTCRARKSDVEWQ